MAGGNEEQGMNSRFGKPPIIAGRPVLKVEQLREVDLRFGNDLFSEQSRERGTDPVCFSHLLFAWPSCYMCWTMRRLFGQLPADQELRVYVNAVTKIEQICSGN